MLQVEGFNSCTFSAVIWFSTFNLWVSSASTLYPNDQELLYFFYLHVPFSSPLYLGSDISFWGTWWQVQVMFTTNKVTKTQNSSSLETFFIHDVLSSLTANWVQRILYTSFGETINSESQISIPTWLTRTYALMQNQLKRTSTIHLVPFPRFIFHHVNKERRYSHQSQLLKLRCTAWV